MTKTKEFRIRSGRKQCEVADILGVSRVYYNYFENGTGCLSLRRVGALIDLLGLSDEEALAVFREAAARCAK